MPRRNLNGPKRFSIAALFLLKRGDGVGKTKVGKGSKAIVVTDRHGLPISLYVDSTQPHESTLAEATLQRLLPIFRREAAVEGGPCRYSCRTILLHQDRSLYHPSEHIQNQ